MKHRVSTVYGNSIGLHVGAHTAHTYRKKNKPFVYHRLKSLKYHGPTRPSKCRRKLGLLHGQKLCMFAVNCDNGAAECLKGETGSLDRA